MIPPMNTHRFTSRSILLAAATLALAGGGVGLALAATGGSSGSVTATTTAMTPAKHHQRHGKKSKGVFNVHCTYSHSANDDPILMPGQSGASMLHDFFANQTTSASSSSASLTGGATTCATSADASGYWVPALYDNGQRVLPTRITAYYKAASKKTSTAALPAGLQMIAGNEQGTTPVSTKLVSWNCRSPKDAGKQGPEMTSPPQCASTQELRLTIHFPSCWDGHTLSGMSQNNVVYPTGTRCPSDHPVAIPRLALHVLYPSVPAGKFTLSTGPGTQGSIYTEHADFLDGWNPAAIDRLVSQCLDTHRKCGQVKGPNATPRPPRMRMRTMGSAA